MYPPQTSLIPVTVALSRFFEEQGLSAFFENYPFWYLSSTPYRYLTGPIIPLISASLHKVLSDVTLFDITIWLVIVSYVISVFGWLILINKIRDSRFKILDLRFIIHNSLFIILLVVLPWRLFSALALSEASFTIARNFLPWVLLAFWGAINKGDRGKKTVAVIAASLLLLVNTSILPIFLVGLASLILAASFKKGKIRKIGRRIKNSLFLILISLFLVTFWYTPGYWITVIANPSIGGASGIKVFLRIIDLLKSSVPLVLAIGAVYFSKNIKSKLAIFALTWTFTFLFLTTFRFIGDPDFWMDWSTWLSELEVGFALLISTFAFNILRARKFEILSTKYETNQKFKLQNSKQFSIWYLAFGFLLLILPFYLTWRTHLALGKPRLISREIPEGVRSLDKLAETVGTNRVFLSGSTVFWANAFYDIYQVRGGRDQVAVHPTWDKAAYELREGKESADSLRWLDELDVSYVLVHGPKSYEYYHDFRNINKWKIIGNVVWEESGDIIYEISK